MHLSSRDCLVRKLISLSGYRGFIQQLLPGEILVLEYSGECSIEIVQIDNELQFERLVYGLDGHDIRGFWSSHPSYFWGQSVKNFTIATPFEEDELTFKTAVHRPVEDLVLGAIVQGSNLNRYLRWMFGSTRSLIC